MSARALVKELAPPVFVDLCRRWSGRSLCFSDRVPVRDQSRERLCIRHVPHTYQASEPCWTCSRHGLLDRLSSHWRIVADDPYRQSAARTDGLAFEFRGLILERNR